MSSESDSSVDGDPGSATSVTLLTRLRDLDDREAWNAFVDRYAPRIYGWCRRYQLQDSDAADVTQEVLRKLVGAMRQFEYDAARGSFRGWLKTVTANAVRDLVRSVELAGRGSGDTQVMQRLASLEDEASVADLSTRIEAAYEQELLEEAEARVQLRVKPHTYQAYRCAAVEQQPPAEVAAQLGMSVDEVYVAKSRVIKMLREEVKKLDLN
jgi:RNA polymerase sigma-70 factor (ECF subfamily)